MTGDFKCRDCSYTYEEWALRASDWHMKCPRCKSLNIKRLPSAPAFKITGYSYNNEYNRGKNN